MDPADPAFQRPTKQVGPRYGQEEAQALAKEKGWAVAPDGDAFRRVVASPLPRDIVEWHSVQALLQVGGGLLVQDGGRRRPGMAGGSRRRVVHAPVPAVRHSGALHTPPPPPACRQE